MTKTKNPSAVALGRLGGKAISKAKTDAARANGKMGGRPVMPSFPWRFSTRKFTKAELRGLFIALRYHDPHSVESLMYRRVLPSGSLNPNIVFGLLPKYHNLLTRRFIASLKKAVTTDVIERTQKLMKWV